MSKIRGEYWIQDGWVDFADGDVGDMGHQAIAANYFANKHIDELINLADDLGLGVDISNRDGQTCSKCGHCHEDNRLNQSEFKCLSCNYENNADLNAAIDISRASINKPIVDNRKVKSQTQSL